MRILIIFVFIISVESKFNSDYCRKICHLNQYCVEKCNHFVDNGLTNVYQTPHCGLTSLRNVSHRVMGGHESKPHQYPWFVTLYTKLRSPNGRTIYHYYCGGTIINNRFIMTAAHCVKNNQTTRIDGFVAGTNNLYLNNTFRIQINPMRLFAHSERISVNQIYLPKEYIFQSPILNDIALIKTSKPIEFLIQNDIFVINSICLTHRNDNPVGKAVLAGTGDVYYNKESETVKTVELQIIDRTKCQNIIRENNYSWKYDFKKVICTIGSVAPGSPRKNLKAPLLGDSGSALMQYYDGRAYPIGICSNGALYVDVYTSVSQYLPWINSVINNAHINSTNEFDKSIEVQINNK